MNVDLDLLSVSDLARRIYFNDGAPWAGSREDPTPVVPSQYMHETCGIIFNVFNIFIGSNQSLAWGIYLVTQTTNPIVQTCPEPARLQKVASGNRPGNCRRSMSRNVVHHLR